MLKQCVRLALHEFFIAPGEPAVLVLPHLVERLAEAPLCQSIFRLDTSVTLAMEEAHRNGARLGYACAEVGITLRILQRGKRASGLERVDRGPRDIHRVPAHALSAAEREELLKCVNEPCFAEMPLARIVPMLTDEGICLASESRFIRKLRSHGQTQYRGRPKGPQRVRAPSTHVASAPRHVFCWGMTYLPATLIGRWFSLCLILDLYSQEILGFEVHETDDSEHAASRLRRTVVAEDLHTLESKFLLQRDNGEMLKATAAPAMTNWIGLGASFSRRRASDDNAFVESLFRTAKYGAQVPTKGFADLEQARQCARSLVHWYNHEHCHSAIPYVSATHRHTGDDHAILQAHYALYQQAKTRTPRFWTRLTRNWTPITVSTLNPNACKP